ncbi:uncharacterized protein LOC121854804 isoform X2 [Homarus americanus]|uniref:Putative Ecdysteroid kinase-containing protein 17 n=1 Tax=Homarus americanus TaxID=6706 RepID=A0A8J5MLG7_HOMAM|nr:uncharacterized protein LOC121854804 isoform X2 [Homarus americanus]KAG7155587.1 putative Ecdysteroid kinase-containing protein 17 [Homarus americanus]
MATSIQPLRNDKEIDQQWLETMLTQKFGNTVEVHSWASTLPNRREGFLSEIAFVKVKYTVEGSEAVETQLVFKFLPQEADLRSFLSNGGLAKREVEFYQFANSPHFQDICKKNGIVLPIPELYYAGYTEDAITIVLSDLNVDKYKCVIVKDGSNFAQTKTALQAVAVIHAAGVIYIHQHGQDSSLSTLAAEFNTEFYDQFFLPNLNTLAEKYDGSSMGDSFRAFIPLTKQIRSTSRKFPLINTIVHGDMWAGQLLYSDDESLASIIDWQFCRIDNPVIDIMSMLYMSSDPKLLSENLEQLLESYWQTFSKVVTAGGVTPDVTFEQLLANVENMWMYGFMFLAVSIHDFLNGDNISEYRLFGAMSFLEKNGFFKRFLEKYASQENI